MESDPFSGKLIRTNGQLRRSASRMADIALHEHAQATRSEPAPTRPQTPDELNRKTNSVISRIVGRPFRADHTASQTVEYEDRTSEAAIDQGWGPVTLPEMPRTRLYEVPGQGRNRSNTGGLATPTEAQGGLSDDEIDAQQRLNEAGAEDARSALHTPAEER